ncbi:hypothetical protein AAHE18_19G031400 [Arachis hypogaea]
MAATVSEDGGSSSESALIFMGTGCSSAIPYSRCLISPSHPLCHVCFQSLSLPPNRNVECVIDALKLAEARDDRFLASDAAVEGG